MPESFYAEMEKMLKKYSIELEDTNNKQKIKEADNFIATFTPQKKPDVIMHW